MQQISEDEYAMKFCMLIILDERKVSGMDRYEQSFRYILESYKKSIKNRSNLVIDEQKIEEESAEFKEKVRVLTKLCKMGNINTLLHQGNFSQSALFALLVEAIYRTMILVRFYAPDGELVSKLIKETYCSSRDKSDIQICRELNISRATYYRRKHKGIMYAGYFFYEAVLPQMEGRL